MKTLAYRFTALLFAALLAASLMAQTPVRVVSIVSLAAGSNAIGKLAANSGVDIGDVDVASIAAGNNNIGNMDIVTLPALVAGTANIGDVDVLTLPNVTVGTFPDNEPFNMAQSGGVAIVSDPCQREARIFFDIDQTAGEELINGTASERIVICELFLMSATAQSVALVSGTGTVCATSTTSVLGFGGLSAATGQLLGISGGFQRGDGGHALGTTTADDDNVCLLQSASGQVSGGGSYVSLVP